MFADEVVFNAGEQGGDIANNLVGAQSGTLFPGIQYQFGVFAYTQGSGSATTTETGAATGFGRLTLTALPEPTTGLLLGLGLLGAVVRRRV